MTARHGRHPNCRLARQGQDTRLQEWGMDLLEKMLKVAALVDGETDHKARDAVQVQIEKMRNPDLTPSARMLTEMELKNQSFFNFAQSKSLQHQAYFASFSLDDREIAHFDASIADSLRRQYALEAHDNLDFDQFLTTYFAQAEA